ncbi:unnamed protein product [Linum trigynum]|uniref:Uncharacterized protein n=1 Tax=Linum trigynum TaxID=586398 RepID=A0AAV2G9P3_9ROSI
MLKYELRKVLRGEVLSSSSIKLGPFSNAAIVILHTGHAEDTCIHLQAVRVSIAHRVTSEQVAVAGMNSKDIEAVQTRTLLFTLPGRERDKFEGKIRAVVQSLIDNGIDVKVHLD